MNCQSVVEQIITLSGRVALAPEVEAHLWSCAACARVHREQRALWVQMDAWEAPEISAGFDRRLFVRIGRRMAQPWALLDGFLRLLRPLQPAFPAALAGMLLVAGVVAYNGRSAAPPADVVTVQTLDREEVSQIETALDDLKMLSDFEILPVAPAGEGNS